MEEEQVYSDVFDHQDMPLCKRLTKKARRLTTSPVDLISSLPNDVLAHILLFVGAKEAVQTSVLSKSWRRMWAFVPVLNLDVDEFLPELGHDEHTLNKEEMLICEANFSEFVIGSLQNREMLKLDTFRLQWSTKRRSEYCTSALVDKCVSYATEFEPQTLLLHVFVSEFSNLNHNKIFTCASLEDVSLMVRTDKQYQAIALAPGEVVSLPRLKRLEIGFVVVSDTFLRNLLSGCPALEELALCECFLYTSEICSTVLKSLVLCRCMTNEKLCLSTPELRHLKILESENMREIFPGNQQLASLADASISIPRAYDDEEFQMLLRNLSNAAILYLSLQHLPNATTRRYTNKVHEKDDGVKFPAFENLRSLVLGNMGDYEADLVELFLRHSPNLKELTWQCNKIEFNSAMDRHRTSMEVAMKECRRQVNLSMDALDESLKKLLAPIWQMP